MSTHQNNEVVGIASISEGVKVEGPGKFIGHQIGLALTASVGLTMPGKGETMVVVQADGGDVRFRLDGVAPTGTAGVLIKNGASLTLTAEDAAAARFIQSSAQTSLLNAWFSL